MWLSEAQYIAKSTTRTLRCGCVILQAGVAEVMQHTCQHHLSRFRIVYSPPAWGIRKDLPDN